MSFSVIAANFNKEQFLESFFNSFKGVSDLVSYELIFIDDGSTDQSLEIARNYESLLPLKIIILEQNHGPAAARNLGLKAATYSNIVFCDTDITFAPNTLIEGYDLFTSKNLDILTFNLDISPLTDSTMGRVYLLEEYEQLETERIESGPHKYFTTTFSIAKKEWFDSVGPFDETFTGPDIEDLVLGFKSAPGTRFWFSRELTFRHAYPSNIIVIKKAFSRAFHLGQLELRSLDNNPLLDNTFRKFSYFVSLIWVTSFLFMMFGLINKNIFIYVTIAEIFIHYRAYLLGIKSYGLFFSFGLFFGRLIYVLSAFIGYALGKVYPKKAV